MVLTSDSLFSRIYNVFLSCLFLSRSIVICFARMKFQSSASCSCRLNRVNFFYWSCRRSEWRGMYCWLRLFGRDRVRRIGGLTLRCCWGGFWAAKPNFGAKRPVIGHRGGEIDICLVVLLLNTYVFSIIEFKWFRPILALPPTPNTLSKKVQNILFTAFPPIPNQISGLSSSPFIF